MAVLSIKRLGFLKAKPAGPSGSGVAAVYALGDKVLASKGVNPHLVKAMRRALENDRRLQTKLQAGGGN